MAIGDKKYFSGYGKPIFIILDPITNNRVDELTFPQTLMPDGLKESWAEECLFAYVISPSLTNYKRRLVKKTLGWRPAFYLDYGSYINNDTMINKVTKLQGYEDDGYTIMLVPRADNRRRKYEVKRIPNSVVEWGILGGGQKSIGNKGVYLDYIAVNLTKFSPGDPNAVQYTGWGLPRFGVRTTA